MISPLLVTFSIYLVAVLLVGWLGYRATRDLSDYILGGRRLGSFVTALAAGASDMSGWLLMGLPGAVFLFGLSKVWIAIGLVIGAWLNWRFVAAKLRIYTERCNNALTLPDYFTNRFQDHSNILRIFTAITILIFFTFYCASGVVAAARLFEDMFNLPYETAIWVGAAATITYVFVGGFLAVSWMDTIQGSLMITALIMAPLMLVYANGGFAESFNILAASAAPLDLLVESAAANVASETPVVTPTHLSLFQNLDTIALISLIGWGLGYFGQPHILVRFMAAESAATIPKARRISITWMAFCLIGACSVGLFGAAYFGTHLDQAANVIKNSEVVFIETAKQLFNPWVAGFLLAAILAAVMSTLACQLLVCSSALTEDIYRTFLRKKASQKELLWFGRAMVFGIALCAIWIAATNTQSILTMVGYAWAGFGAAFGPIVLLSLSWKRMTRNGAIAGIIVGATTVIIWKAYGWLGLYEIIPGFLFATIAIITVSLMSKPPSSVITKKFEEVQTEFSKLKAR
ncbi:MAG: sodium:proline symporter [Gammaproteobacteria bacterium]|jgi:sodium/proline symporter|nr:sodium:proline symporter [Gammaproteobacteria bacterium]